MDATPKQPSYNNEPPPCYPSQQYGSPNQSGMGFQPTVAQPVMQTVILPLEMGGDSRRMTCPHCFADINTSVTYKDGRMTHIAALLLCLFGFWCCCCIPYCVDSCKDADHECPNCHRHLGTFRR